MSSRLDDTLALAEGVGLVLGTASAHADTTMVYDGIKAFACSQLTLGESYEMGPAGGGRLPPDGLRRFAK